MQETKPQHVFKCRLCGGLCYKDVIQREYVYYKCRGCHTSQVMPQPSQTQLHNIYFEYHRSGVDGGLYTDCEQRTRIDFPAKLREICRIVKRAPSTLRLLDVGCGKGYFVKEACKKGFAAEGFDCSESAIEFATKSLNVKATAGQLECTAKSAWRNAFDIVTLWATIEHVPNPEEILNSVCSLLRPGGFLFLDTGLGNTVAERFLPGYTQWYDAPQHLFVFSQGQCPMRSWRL